MHPGEGQYRIAIGWFRIEPGATEEDLGFGDQTILLGCTAIRGQATRMREFGRWRRNQRVGSMSGKQQTVGLKGVGSRKHSS